YSPVNPRRSARVKVGWCRAAGPDAKNPAGAGFFAAAALRRDEALYLAEQYQDQNDDQDGAQNAGRAIAPASGVGEDRQAANQQEDQNDDEDSTQAHGGTPFFGYWIGPRNIGLHWQHLFIPTRRADKDSANHACAKARTPRRSPSKRQQGSRARLAGRAAACEVGYEPG